MDTSNHSCAISLWLFVGCLSVQISFFTLWRNLIIEMQFINVFVLSIYCAFHSNDIYLVRLVRFGFNERL